jgi:hypothetical protein
MTSTPAQSQKPHGTTVVVWDVPPAIERGDTFNVRLGVKCAAGCHPENWIVQISDHQGEVVATSTLSESPWPGTTALYFAKVELQAPDEEGCFEWQVKAPLTAPSNSHNECVVGFRVRVQPAPECVLTVLAIDAESQVPVKDARVVVHPYRSLTDERGVAALRVPKGTYRVFVSGGNYFPFRSDGEVKTDTMIRAELVEDQILSDADIWP